MAEQQSESVGGLIRSLLDDMRELVREEIALARAEIREEIALARTVAAAFGGALMAAILGAVMLCVALGGAVAYLLGWPGWSGYLIVGLLLFGGAIGLVQYGRGRLAAIRTLPKTTETLKENLSWIQSKSARR
jgi:hypothetical protein